MYRTTISAVVAVLVLVGTAHGASSCRQKFTIYGKTEGDRGALLWDVQVGGECEYTTSYCMFLGDDRPAILSTNGSSGDTFRQFLATHRQEQSKLLTADDGKYYFSKNAFATPPLIDTTFIRKFNRVINEGGRNAWDWYRACPVNCSDYPTFVGIDAKLVFELIGGLYKNYTFSQAVYYPKSRYFVIVTEQPTTAVGLDTMHGLLVYRLSERKVSR